MTTTKQKPVTTLRDGRIRASVWENSSENGKFYAITFSRLYTDAEGQLQNSSSFSGVELLKLSRLASKAYDTVAQLRIDNAVDEEAEPEAQQ